MLKMEGVQWVEKEMGKKTKREQRKERGRKEGAKRAGKGSKKENEKGWKRGTVSWKITHSQVKTVEVKRNPMHHHRGAPDQMTLPDMDNVELAFNVQCFNRPRTLHNGDRNSQYYSAPPVLNCKISTPPEEQTQHVTGTKTNVEANVATSEGYDLKGISDYEYSEPFYGAHGVPGGFVSLAKAATLPGGKDPF
ncbi:hypothetical protein B0H19DRAFT_1067771 [Mycena capillaripes]|nr:hypothetical protein B0H19DRAFT_1067771 [Mycena capillaripes]